MKRKHKIIIISAVILLMALLGWVASEPIHVKLMVGGARIIGNKVPVQLSVDGVSLENVHCFREDSLFNGEESNRLVLWVQNPQTAPGRHILIVDPDSRSVYLPNWSTKHYKLLFKNWLIQSDSGALGVPFGDSKLDPNDPDFQQAGNMISFSIPAVLDLPSGRWELKLN